MKAFTPEITEFDAKVIQLQTTCNLIIKHMDSVDAETAKQLVFAPRFMMVAAFGEETVQQFINLDFVSEDHPYEPDMTMFINCGQLLCYRVFDPVQKWADLMIESSIANLQ